jgi:hypothetical protein
MERLLIAKNGTRYATDVTNVAEVVNARGLVHTLAAGSLAAFEKNGTFVTSGGAFVKTDTKGLFVMGMTAGAENKLSPLINWETLKYNKQVYVPAVAPVGILGGAGIVLSGPKVVGAQYGVVIQDLEKETWERNKYSIDLTIVDPAINNAQILAAVVAAFNHHPKANKLALSAVLVPDLGITFAGLVPGHKFMVYGTGLLYGNEFFIDGTNGSVVVRKGQGTNAQILKLEASTAPIEGKTSTTQSDDLGEIWKVPSMVEAGINYTVYVLEWWDQRDVAYTSNNANPKMKRLNIAVPTNDAVMVAAMDNILADLVA